VVHGLQPEFDAVFGDTAAAAAFFDPFVRLTHFVPRKYIYQPR
jgi:hypothetical protein